MSEKGTGIYGPEAWQTQPANCTWRYGDDPDGGHWIADCGAEWWFEDGGPEENDMNFCPKCGRALKGFATDVV